MKRMKSWIALTVGILFLTLPLGRAFAATEESAEKAERQWTVAMYIDTDSNLSVWGFAYLIENLLAELIPSPEVTTVVYFDTLIPPGTLRIEYDHGLPKISIEREKNFGDGETLAQFGVETFTKYPADKYLLLIMDHGGGWRKSCVDVTNGNDCIYTPELVRALAKISDAIGKPIDVLQWVACLMGNVEVIYDVAPYVDYYIGSPQVELTLTLSFLKDALHLGTHPDITPRDYAKAVVKTSGIVLSGGYPFAFATSDIDYLAQAMDELAVTLDPQVYKNEILNAYKWTKKYHAVPQEHCEVPVFIDIYDFASELMKRVEDPQIKEICARIIDSENQVIIARPISPAGMLVGGNGLSGTLMHDKGDVPEYIYENLLEEYSVLEFAHDTAWDDFLADVLYL
jgi:hypothetical protein